ncbi:MAG: endonuclease/exonuclease/phosphatase family protein [Clostridia bacterium]|nr:endonuclease/exonuclease/phosphatase family protein [Clostridia bacterium]
MIIMTNNQWNRDANSEQWLARGEDCSADARMPGLIRAYTEVLPDVLGLQEVSAYQSVLMRRCFGSVALPDGSTAEYGYISGGYTPLFYRSDRLKLVESGFFSYPSGYASFPGNFNDAGSKTCNYGVFVERDTGNTVAVMTTHLWWRSGDPASGSYRPGSDGARAYQMSIACERMEEVIRRYDCPALLMGDFNAVITSPALRTAAGYGWADAHDVATGFADGTRGHHPCSPSGWRRDAGGRFEQAIDHILIKNPGRAEITFMKRKTDEYFDRLSDHYPLYIELRFN